ncbi:MAG: 3-oxoacyl-ACP synthase [Lentisphaerae bacterium RIFOXYB12_FULL_65_16]|nr:MAG: 3-oxoacyl-ACP synthase [Lentisphaerae bacterium RIFOXYA12_64_32]OGV90032.1 MAG: 3-oxoacyl-ACP synthase [Lentisphaerae bacterium RIFOXYB12_FULL_65_16]
MTLRRVVVTGLGVVSPIGRGMPALMDGLVAGKSGVVNAPALSVIKDIRSRVAALAPDLDGREIPRHFRRSMSKMSIYATLACQEALLQAGLTAEHCAGGRLGVVIGSTIQSTDAIEGFFRDYLTTHAIEQMRSTLFFQIMNHSCAANVAQTLGITGRTVAPAAACATGGQTVGFGYEWIASGKQDMMLCGGADEFHPLATAVFDVVNAASTRYNDRPTMTPRPFDRQRDGVVCGEGGGIVVLEALDSARARGVPVLAELLGFATVSTPDSISNPSAGSMEECMRLALEEAKLRPEQVDYVNAHATATELGDIAESAAIHRVFGHSVPVSSLKGHLGHTMAASGAIELAATIAMLNGGRLIPTLNLDEVEPQCAPLRLPRQVESVSLRTAVKNCFAFGGINSTLVIRRDTRD